MCHMFPTYTAALLPRYTVGALNRHIETGAIGNKSAGAASLQGAFVRHDRCLLLFLFPPRYRAAIGGTVPVEESKTVTTISGIPLKTVYTAADVANLNYANDLGNPGHEPYTRGPYPDMYRARLWRIFQLSGFGLPEDERERIKLLLHHGETGFIMEPDLMTLYGMYDIDSREVRERSEELGMYGAPLLSLRDYERALEGIPIENLYAHPGAATPVCSAYCHACYFALAGNRGTRSATFGAPAKAIFSFLTLPHR